MSTDERGSRLRWWPLWILLGVSSENWWWRTYPATGVALLRPSCECRSPEISGGCITCRWRGAVDPLPHLPATARRWHSLALCFVAAGDGHGLLSRLAGWSCSQDGSPRLRLEACGFLRCDWKAGVAVGRRSWPIFQCLRRISRSGVGEGGSRLLVASLDSLLSVGPETWWWWTYLAARVALLRPSCECRSPEISGGCITRRWRGAADPLPHLPATAGRWHNLAPCFVQQGTVMGSSLIWQGGLAARMGLCASVRRRAVF